MVGSRAVAGQVYFLTVTAPGRREHCKRSGCSRSSCGHVKCPCTPAGGVDLAGWNAGHGKRWNHLATSLRRAAGGDLQYFRACEVQDGKRAEGRPGRGALHDHAALVTATGLPSLQKVRALAVNAGFGHEVDLVPVDVGSSRVRQIARYVSKYVSKAVDSRQDVPWEGVDLATGEVLDVPGRYRAWSQSQCYGRRMADLRAQARAYALVRGAAQAAQLEGAAVQLLEHELGAAVEVPSGRPPPSSA